MAYRGDLAMSIQDASGNYYSAVQNTDCSWLVTTGSARSFITLPDGWMDSEVNWERDTSYLGVFRSQGGSGYKYSMDARAIIQYIRNTQGLQGYGLVSIYNWNEGAFTYDVVYSSELDFKTYSDDHQSELLTISTLDNGLIRLIRAYGDTKYNVPVFKAVGPSAWVLNDAEIIQHNGIKLLYNATYASTATPTQLLDYTTPNGNALRGFNNGSHGTGVNDGRHTLPQLQPFNTIQNNGTTAYIGNTILSQKLVQGTQGPGVNNVVNENVFSGTNNSQPYTRRNYSLFNYLENTSESVDMYAAVSGQFVGNITANVVGGTGIKLMFVLFEVDFMDNATIANYTYTTIMSFDIPAFTPGYAPPNGGAFSNYPGGVSGAPASVTLNYNKAYVFGIIWDNDGHDFQADVIGFALSALQFSFLSKYDSGLSGVAIPAPSLNPSLFAGFRLNTLLQKVTSYLPTVNTDGYGFPLPVTTPYSFESDYLSNPSLPPMGDIVPYNVMWTSAYCLQDLQGQSYVTAALNDIFDFCKKQLGCGMAIEGNTLRFENLRYFFNNSVMILDLGADVADFSDEQMTDGLGANLKLGYTKVDTTTDAGIDPFCTELFFNTPLSGIPSTMDYEETNVITEMYGIDKIRAQKNTQPLGTSFDPGNPSSSNQSIALYCSPPVITYETFYDPINNLYPSPYPVSTVEAYSNAQSNDSSATSAPYVYGLYYPDTAINLKLSPCRALQRDAGALLHSVLDIMDTSYLTFRNTAVMQYNNVAVGLSGIESNLNIGSGLGGVTTEFKDVLIGNLPPQLFRPIIYKVKSKYPINMHQLLNSNPNGYVRFLWKGKGYNTAREYKGFISKAKQTFGTNAATEFELWATPDTIL